MAGRMVVEIRGVDSLRDRLRMMRSHVRRAPRPRLVRRAGCEATMKGLAQDTGRLRDSIRHEVQAPLCGSVRG